MPPWDRLLQYLGIYVIAAPAVLVAVLGCAALLNRPFSERATGRAVQWTIVSGLLAALTILGVMLTLDARSVALNFGTWVHVPQYHFSVKFVFDRLSVPLVILTFLLCGTIGAFATRYMHREQGFNRFFVLYALFVLGMQATATAGTIETLFAGWELVGLSSALLVAFFHDRPAPVRNGLRVWAVYRISDAALLIAAVLLHHLTGEGEFDKFLVGGSWPEAHTVLSQEHALWAGLLLLVAAAGKSALVPFCGWLPRAMEGPTPSSAVFYGALSVHLGAYLLLRVSPLLDASLALTIVVTSLGLATALYATLVARVQTDIKSALSFASLTQVGIIVAEIGLGFRYLALIHILGHGCLRTLQFVRAPTLLQDYRALENAIGDRLPPGQAPVHRWLSDGLRQRVYVWALERGYLDAFLQRYFVNPFLAVLRLCDRLERGWLRLLAGPSSPAAGRREDDGWSGVE